MGEEKFLARYILEQSAETGNEESMRMLDEIKNI